MQLSEGKHNLCSVFAFSFLCLKSLLIFALLFSFIISLRSTPQLSLQMWLESACLGLLLTGCSNLEAYQLQVSKGVCLVGGGVGMGLG